VLYVDADCEFRSAPALIGELLAGGTEFAIYNWAADRHTEAYLPAPIVMGAGRRGRSGRALPLRIPVRVPRPVAAAVQRRGAAACRHAGLEAAAAGLAAHIETSRRRADD